MSNKEIKVGDFVLPRMSGIIEQGDPAYVVEEITDEGKYRIVQTIGSYQHRMELPKEKLNRL
ncbi:MAG: hypothetical protein CMD43_03100 [Gammaproteobacteria bacterium]|jgi:hypothetical protein|nr:hypothetical protein [Gammaproteobacteria bacterium]|tara:strand:+ start:902 stop:1087 length:186 start_codon:yes stop_codon:yes gene_type:complete